MNSAASNMFRLLLLAICLLAQSGHCLSADEGADRPNILWVVADDLSPDLGCYGYKHVATPNIDRLANQGFVFQNAFATSPACSPSRSAFVTGQYQTRLGAHHHRTRNKKPLADGVTTIMELLQSAGYFVTNKGKTDFNFATSFRFHGKDWKNRKQGQPFFAQIQIHDTHRPFKKHKHASTRLAEIELPKRYPDHKVTRADWANYLASIESMDKKVGNILNRLDEEGLTESTAVFFFGDHGRAHLWDKQWLYDGGIRVPLIVRLPSSFKNNLRKRLENLVSLIDLVPVTAHLAGVQVSEKLPAQNFLSDEWIGRKMVFATRDRSGDAVDRVRAVRTKRYKYIRNERSDLAWSTRSSYKELSYPALVLMRTLKKQNRLSPVQLAMMAPNKPAEELYDLDNDPEELLNLAAVSEHQATLESLRRALLDWQNVYDVDAAEKEMPDDKLAALIESKKKWYRSTMKKRGLKPGLSDEEYLAWWMKTLKVNQ